MLATDKVDKKITTLLPNLTDKQKKVVLSVVETFVNNQVDSWKDDSFIAELDRRTMEFESGKLTTITLEQLENKARKAYKVKNTK